MKFMRNNFYEVRCPKKQNFEDVFSSFEDDLMHSIIWNSKHFVDLNNIFRQILRSGFSEHSFIFLQYRSESSCLQNLSIHKRARFPS